MFEYLTGKVTALSPAHAVVETSGIGYFVHISVSTYSWLQQQESPVKIFLHEVIREDAHTLYGFSDDYERFVFRHLISVSGIGPATAQTMLSSLGPAEIAGAIAAGDAALLKSVKGIGAKTAERTIVDLRDKITRGLSGSVAVSGAPAVLDEALAALQMLGFNRLQAEKALRKLYQENPGISVEELVRQSLKIL